MTVRATFRSGGMESLEGGDGGGGFATAEPVTVTVTLCEPAMRGLQCMSVPHYGTEKHTSIRAQSQVTNLILRSKKCFACFAVIPNTQ